MEIRERILSDIKTSMKEKNAVRLNTLRFLNSAIKNCEIDMRPTPISENDIMGVIRKLVKQRKESIEQYAAGNRQDLVASETAELHILEEFLPAQMTKEKLEALVAEVITALNAKSIKDMGPVMKEVIARAQGQADNKTVSELIKSKLQA